MQFLSHEILLAANFFDPLIAFWVDEKGAHKGAQEAGLTHHNSESGLYGKFRVPNKLKLLPYSLATFR